MHFCENMMAAGLTDKLCEQCRSYGILVRYLLEKSHTEEFHMNIAPDHPITFRHFDGPNNSFLAYIPGGNTRNLEHDIRLQGYGIEIILKRDGTWDWDDTAGG